MLSLSQGVALAHYESEKDLLEAIQKKFVAEVRRHLTPEWHEPWDDRDVEELWEKVRGAASRVVKPQRTKRVQHGVWRKRALEEAQVGTPAEEGLKSGAMALSFRGDFGLTDPVPLGDLRNTLLRLGALEQPLSGEKWEPLAYPSSEYSQDGLRLCHIAYLAVPSSRVELRVLAHFCLLISRLMRLHPGLILGCLLCDIPVHRDIVIATVEGDHITMYTKYLETPPSLVSYWYSFVRAVEIFLKRSVVEGGPKEPTLPRPRVTSERILALLGFVEENKALDWSKRWEQWNTQYRQWAYGSKNSMRATYYRANGAPKQGKPKRGGRSEKS